MKYILYITVLHNNVIYYVPKEYTIHIKWLLALRTQKACTVPVYPLVPLLLQSLNSPGSPTGLPRGGCRWNRAQLCAQSSPTSPGSAKAHSDDAGSVFAFLCQFSVVWGGLGLCLFVPHAFLVLGGLKGQETHEWFLTTRVFWHFLYLWHNWGCGAL